MHEESLRRILACTVDLTEEQQREIVGHLEDSIDAKMAKGMTEMDAVARSFEELGDLKKISRQFRTRRGGFGTIVVCYFSLLLLVGLNVTLTPVLMKHIAPLNLHLPALLNFFASISQGLTAFWPVTVGVLAALGILAIRFRNNAALQKAADPLSVGLSILTLASIFAVVMPFVSVVEGIGGIK